MVTDKQTLVAREREAWDGFRALVDRVGVDRWTEPDADGWTVKDVLWHVAYWWRDLADMFDAMREGTFTEPPEDDTATDEENARVLLASRAMSVGEVERGVEEARARMLAALASLTPVDDAAERWFLWETIDHYDEHLPNLRRLADGT